jgi:hypothetical protein
MENQPENRAKHDQDQIEDGREWLPVQQQADRRQQGGKDVDHRVLQAAVSRVI